MYLSSSFNHRFTLQQSVKGRVLLVEDNIDNQRQVSLYLKKIGAEIVVASNGQEALAFDYASNNDFDLILINIQMPIMNGLEAIKKLRASGYSKPIVALAASSTGEEIDNCYAAGCSDFIAKPINKTQFLDCMLNYLHPSDKQDDVETPIVSSLLSEEPELFDLISRFISQLPNKIERIKENHDKADWDELRKNVHDLKGISGNYGFDELFKTVQTMEFELLKENYSGIKQKIDQIEKLGKRIIAGIEKSSGEVVSINKKN